MLRERDSALAAGDGKDAAANEGDGAECPFCMEPYSDDVEERVPRILQCGHSGCHGCYAQMLHCAKIEGAAKRLGCPMCKAETKVKGGKAANLPKVFSLLR